MIRAGVTHLQRMPIVCQVEQSLYQVQTSPSCNFFVVNVRLYFQYFCGGAVAGLLGKTEDVRIPQDLLEQRQLAFCVLPMSVEEIHGEKSLEALGLQSQLESFHQEDETGPVLDTEPGVVQLVDDLLPVEGCLQLVDSLDEDLHVPGFVIFMFFFPETVGVRGYGERGVIVQPSVGPHHHSDHFSNCGSVHLSAAKLEMTEHYRTAPMIVFYTIQTCRRAARHSSTLAVKW